MLYVKLVTTITELGYKSTDMTQKYLRFSEKRRLDDFPSLKDYISKYQNNQKTTSLVNSF